MERLPTSQLLLLTPSLFLHAFQSLLLPAFGLLGLLVAPAFMEVLHHHAYKHVEHEEGNDQEEGDEVEQHPWVVVHYRLKNNRKIRKDVNSGWLQTRVRHNQVRSADVDARPRQLMAQVIELAKLLYLTHKCFVAATCFATSSFHTVSDIFSVLFYCHCCLLCSVQGSCCRRKHQSSFSSMWRIFFFTLRSLHHSF